MQESGIGLDRRVAEFGRNSPRPESREITLAQILSHQAGLVALDDPVDVLDYEAVIAALEKQRPFWPPGTAHGYHARTFGFLLDELVRRITEKRLAEYWHNTFAGPLGLDLWIGLPEAENARTATIYAPKSGKAPEPAAFYREFFQPGTLARRTFDSPSGLNAVSAMNLPANRAQPIVSFGGIGTAAALAKFYATLANRGRLEGKQVFAAAAIAQMERTLASGPDRILQIPTAFSAGFMRICRSTNGESSAQADALLVIRGRGEAMLLPIRKTD